MATKLFLTIPLIAVLTLLHVRVAKGFTLTPPSLSPARFAGTAGETTRCPAAAVITITTSNRHRHRHRHRRPVTFLSMADESESDERQAKRRNQQLGAGALVLFGVLYDFFVTHHGVGFWDPNYIV